MLVNNCRGETNNTLSFWPISMVNYISNIVTISEKDTTVRREFHMGSKGGTVQDFSWISTSSCSKSTVALLGLGDYHLGTPDDNLEWRKGVLSTREMLNWNTLGHRVFYVGDQEDSI